MKHSHRGTKYDADYEHYCPLNGHRAVVKFTVPSPSPRSWSPVLPQARLDVSPPGWPRGPAVLTSVVCISVLEKGGSSFLKEKQVQIGDPIVLQQSEICCSECIE